MELVCVFIKVPGDKIIIAESGIVIEIVFCHVSVYMQKVCEFRAAFR